MESFSSLIAAIGGSLIGLAVASSVLVPSGHSKRLVDTQ